MAFMLMMYVLEKHCINPTLRSGQWCSTTCKVLHQGSGSNCDRLSRNPDSARAFYCVHVDFAPSISSI